MTDYLLDANVFIQAKNLHYGFDFCPAFWDWLVVQNEAGKVASIEKVGDELRAGEDALATWAAERGNDFFLRPDDAVVPALGTVSGWVSGSGYQPASPPFFRSPTTGSLRTLWLTTAPLLLTRFPLTPSTRSRFRMLASDSVFAA